MKKIFIVLMGIILVSIFFIPNENINFIIMKQNNISDIIGNLLTIVTFLAGFVLVILPMKVDASQQKLPVQKRLNTCLIKRNRFLTVLFLLFIVEITLLSLLLFTVNFWIIKMALMLLMVIVIAVIRLFFVIREYVEYSE